MIQQILFFSISSSLFLKIVNARSERPNIPKFHANSLQILYEPI